MDKFSFNTYGHETMQDKPFADASYVDPASDQETRNQLSYPLCELRNFINNAMPFKQVDGNDKVIVLKITDSGLLQYSLDGETFVDTASGGHNIYADNTQLAQKTKLMFRNTNCYNSGDYTVVEGIQGAQGVSVASMVQVEESSSSGGNNKWRATLSNGTTFDFIVKNGLQGEKGDDGEQGNGLVILGTYATLEALQAAHPTGNEGDIYSVGNGVSNTCYCWDINDNGWESIGKVQGEKGAKGDTGDTGATGNGIQSITVVESSVSGGTNVVTITMTGGQTYTFNVKNGAQGAAGEGMKTGGTTGQLLAKSSGLDYDCQWVDPPNSAVWGGITGTLSNQTDLNTALNQKGNFPVRNANISVSATPTQLQEYCAWDTQHLYGYYFDVTVNGITENDKIDNIVMTDTLLASIGYIVTTGTNKLRFYTQDNTAVSGTILELVTTLCGAGVR